MDSSQIEKLSMILAWPIYVNDDGKVTCHAPGCEDGEFQFRIPYRRITVAEYLDALEKHIEEDGHNGSAHSQSTG